MNKYKKGFTPEQAALIALNLDTYKTLDYADQKMMDGEYSFGHNVCLTGELLNEARDILNALIEETCLAHEYDQNNSNKINCLEIYSTYYDEQFNHEFDPQKTQLTKASLAKWFDEAGKTDISKKFKDPEKVITINHFKQAYTAEHSSLIAVGLQNYNSINSAKDYSESQEIEICNAQREVERGGEFTPFDIDERLKDDSINIAIKLKEALIDEIKLACEWNDFENNAHDYAGIGINPNNFTPNSITDIVIYREEINENKQTNYNSTLITKESVATWLWNNGQTQYAVNVLPNIEKILLERSVIESKNKYTWGNLTQVSNKNKSAKTIRTPEYSIIDSLGIMAYLLSLKSSQYNVSKKPNASQIKEAVQRVIDENDLDNNDENKLMISNLNKDINLAFKQLDGRLIKK